MWYRVALLTALVGLVTIPASILTVLFVGELAGLAVLVIGWFFFVPVIPLLAALYRTTGRASKTEVEPDPLEELKRRYASGEISEDEFVDRVERLIEIEDVERDLAVATSTDPRDGERIDPDPDRERGRVLEREK